jgi:lipopolysaccharide export system permease protein
MKLIDRHILKNFLAPFIYILVSLLGLFLVYDVSSKTARFLKHDVSLVRILRFYSLYIPQLVTLGLPMVILLAIVLGMGRMSKNNEITAMRACGVSVLRISSPLFIVALLLAVFSFFMFDRVVTQTYGEAKRFEDELKGKKTVKETIEMGYLLTDDMGSRLRFAKYLPKRKLFQDIEWQKESENPRARVTVTAFEAEWKEDSWWAFHVNVVAPDGTYSPFYRKMRMYEWDFRPEEVTEEKFPEEMSLKELVRNARRFQFSPETVRTLEVQIHRRLALPVLNLLVVAVALPFGLTGGKRGGSVAVGVGVSMLLCLAYYGVSVLISLLRPLPPWIAVWLPNLLFGAGGTIATLRID